ncbi:unnamed protein product [Cunninghamella blakesleeana]
MATTNFGFPYEPYNIQSDFMKALYEVLSNNQIGIFESPTGTLYIPQQSTDTKIVDPFDNEPDWVKNFQLNDEKQRQKEQYMEKKRIYRVELIMFVLNLYSCNITKNKTDDDYEQYVLDDYISDGDDNKGNKDSTPKTNSNSNISKEVLDLLAKFDSNNKKSTNYITDDSESNLKNDIDDGFEQQKIFYASRTHSQLSQFIHEVNKTKFSENVWTISLGSRKNLCINEKIQVLGSMQRINEACMDLQKKSNESERCPYLPSVNDVKRWRQFQEHALSQVQDIEDLYRKGKELHVCPYYGSRQSTKPAQLVVLPYQHLLHAHTRETLGISLKNNIVIIDEAHNLIETISSIHTITITSSQIDISLSQIRMYLEKYVSRLLGKNIVYIKQIITVLKSFKRVLENKERKDTVMTVNEFTHLSDIDHFNLFKIQKYLESSQLAKKLNGFNDKVRIEMEAAYQKEKLINPKTTIPDKLLQLQLQSSSLSILHQLEAFMMCLTHPNSDGRIVITYGSKGSNDFIPQIKYMLLNPAEVFKPIIDEAKSIILAGGTMEPISDFIRGLFPTVPKNKIHHFSCGHIIPSSNLLTLSLASGPSSKQFIFNYDSREDVQLMDEVGKSILNLCNVVPDGMVCFFSSFTYLDTVYKRWSTNESGNILDRISKKKKIFKEPKESNMVDSVLRDYSLHIDSKQSSTSTNGAILLSVVNGKMSEGINFSDRLGRCVVMIGLPFPNRYSVELNEKIKYMNNQVIQDNKNDVNLGQEYYENLCMRGVNQSIGRAIRHKNDYATIVLLDKRYSSPRISKKLPKWIGETIEDCPQFGRALGKVAKFFREKRQL